MRDLAVGRRIISLHFTFLSSRLIALAKEAEILVYQGEQSHIIG